MKSVLLAILLSGTACAPKEEPPEPASAPRAGVEVQLRASDGKTVFADFVEAPKRNKAPVVILLHKAGSNAAEYENIIPKLSEMEFNCVAVDLRSGGSKWGKTNRTSEQYSRDPGYLGAYLDMQAVYEWAYKQGFPKVGVVGSGYSASLALHLAEQFPAISMVAAFSPGEYGELRGSVRGWTSNVICPVYMASSQAEGADTKRLFSALTRRSNAKVWDVFAQYSHGGHGARELLESNRPEAAERYWSSFKKFLLNWKRGWQQ